jgi:hypothetical protein
MHRFSDRAGSADHSRKRGQRCCLPPSCTASAPRTLISRLHSPAYAYPYQRFTNAIPAGYRFEATQALRQVLTRAVGMLDVNPADDGVPVVEATSTK